MKKATKDEIKIIHALLSVTGTMEDKKEIVKAFTGGRSDSTKEMYSTEARLLIDKLREYDPLLKQKRAIFSLAYQIGIIYGDTPEDKRMNAAKLDMFLKERGAVKKALNSMCKNDVVKIHRQFEAMAKKVKKTAAVKQATNAVNELLKELNITTV